jgi:soluble lytic murein transglycosylase-like protein
MSRSSPFLLGLIGALALPVVRAGASEPPRFDGQTFDAPPAHLGALFGPPAAPSLDVVQAHLEAGDLHAATWEAQRVADEAHGRDRDAALVVLGSIHREEGRHNLASAAFTRVRAAKGPLAPWGAFYEAEQDLARGKYWTAAKECETYRTEWPSGRHASDCHRLMAVAYAKAGSWTKARETAAEYDRAHALGPIGEQIELTLVLREVERDPKGMIPRLQQLAVQFDAPLTGRVAEETLTELRAKGHPEAVIPSDPMSARSRAYSLRNTKQTAAAWAAFDAIAQQAADDPATARWVAEEDETFGWRARNWDFLVTLYRAEYEASPTSEASWNLYRAYSRGGRHVEARDWAEVARKKHGNSAHWSRKEEEVARGHLLARDYAGARALFDVVGGRGGWTGQRGRYYAAFAGVMAADADDDTLKRLNALVDARGAYATEALYWRAKVHERNSRSELARADREALVAADPDSWYGALARNALLPADADVTRRDGTWPAEPPPEPPRWSGEAAPLFRLDLPVAGPLMADTDRSAVASRAGFGFLDWDPSGPSEVGRPVQPADNPFTAGDRTRPPRSYLAGGLFDKAGVGREARAFADQHANAWPELRAAVDLARAGLYDLSGPLFSAVYEEWRAAYRSGSNKRHASARQMAIPSDKWRGLMAYTRDHHHIARFTYGMWDAIEDPTLKREALKLGYPLAHDRYVWTHAREHGIDPYLVLGLMRQESTYNPLARSPVGAAGAMQIMPRTGHLLADLKHDVGFTAGDVEDPVVAVGYGIQYLGLLMDRFDGAYPLAVASYNGGPFNVSAWLKGTGSDMPMDAFVEHIPFRETRDYVKKVSAGYSAYLSLYAPEGTLLAPPPTPRGDHPDVVDF